MDFDELIAQQEKRESALQEQRDAATERLAKMGRGEERASDDDIDAVIAERSKVDGELAAVRARLDQLRAAAREDAVTDAKQREHTPTQTRQPAYDEVGRVQREERTYTERKALRASTGAEGGASFFSDAYRSQYRNDFRAQERLERHMREVEVEQESRGVQERATTTSSFGSLVVPQYLPEMYALALRAGRPLANICNAHELPDAGMTLTLPRGTTGAATAVQATENTAVQNTDEVWTDLTINVRTIAGQQDVSRQSLERGTAVDSIIYLDLARAYHANLDNQIINGTGSSGQMLGILNTADIGAATAFGAVPTVTNFSLKVAGAITNVASAGAGIAARVLVMHPRRWGWLTGQVDGSGRPVVSANTVANFNALGVITNPGQISADANGPDPMSSFFIGVHNSGLPVLTDLNVPTNVGTNLEDIVLAADTQELHLWEVGDGMPRELRFEQTTGGSLTTKLVVYSYAAFTAGRYPTAVSKVGGLDSTATFGLVAPSF